MARRHPRIRTAPAPGADPSPQRFPPTATAPETIRAEFASEDTLDAWGDDAPLVERDEAPDIIDDHARSNDDRLREEVPPHHVDV